MPDLAGKGPIGQKKPKAKKHKRKQVRKVSPKKRAHKTAERAAGAWEHMARVKALPCLICGAHGVEVHHLPDPRSDWRAIPLCPFHHRREYGPQAYHYSRRNFNARHGTDEQLLARTMEQLDHGGAC